MNVTYEREVSHCEKSPYLQEVTVLNIYPAINSDFLEILQFKEIGWQIVTKKGEYHKGDRLFFCPPESVIPIELAEEQNITNYLKKGLVRVVRLRKNVSAGLPLGIEIGKKWKDYILHWNDPPRLCMGGDITAREDVPFLFTKFFNMPNLRNVPYTFYDGELIVYSEKIHGCSCRLSLMTNPKTGEKELYIGSHNVVLKEDMNNLYWRTIKTHLDDNKIQLQDALDLEFFGEVYGPGIQNGYTYGLKEPKFVIFNISKNGKYFHPDQIEETCKLLKLPCVIYHRDTFDMKKMENIAESPSEYTDKNIREGIVLISSETPDKMAKLVSLRYLEGR